jgi:hypothetical protein
MNYEKPEIKEVAPAIQGVQTLAEDMGGFDTEPSDATYQSDE